MDSIYGNKGEDLKSDLNRILEEIELIRADMTEKNGMDPIEHVLGRIKDEESMREKCRRRGLPETEESALNLIHDAIGVRVVCAFIDDVFTIRDRLKESPYLEAVEEKDYIRHAKPNGYRSYHMIVKTQSGNYAELQLRTISMDTWAALEHHMKYKKELIGNTELIERELKRCADELASTDESMQTLKDMITMSI